MRLISFIRSVSLENVCLVTSPYCPPFSATLFISALVCAQGCLCSVAFFKDFLFFFFFLPYIFPSVLQKGNLKTATHTCIHTIRIVLSYLQWKSHKCSGVCGLVKSSLMDKDWVLSWELTFPPLF